MGQLKAWWVLSIWTLNTWYGAQNRSKGCIWSCLKPYYNILKIEKKSFFEKMDKIHFQSFLQVWFFFYFILLSSIPFENCDVFSWCFGHLDVFSWCFWDPDVFFVMFYSTLMFFRDVFCDIAVFSWCFLKPWCFSVTFWKLWCLSRVVSQTFFGTLMSSTAGRHIHPPASEILWRLSWKFFNILQY